MSKIRKIPFLSLIFLLGIVSIFFVTRLYHLQSRYLPIFIDEATYVQWAQVGKFDSSQRLLSLVDGLEPLFVWLTIFIMNWVVSPLIAGRLVSVFSGLATLAGLYFLTKELFQNKWTALITTLLYAFFPFALLLDRMAIYVSLFGAFFVWSIYFSVLLAKYLQTQTAFVFGLLLGGGILTKVSGFLSIYLLPLGLFFFPWKKEGVFRRLMRWVLLCLLAVALAMLYYNILQLSPQFAHLSEKGNRFLYSWSDILSINPIRVMSNNIVKATGWLIIYFSIPWIFLLLLSLFVKKARVQIIFLWLWFLIPFASLMLLGKSIYPRYLFFMVLPLIPIIAETLIHAVMIAKKGIVIVCLFCISFLFVSYTDFKILTDFPRAPIPTLDLFQYSNGWPAGGGINQIVAYLQSKSEKGKIYVFSEGVYGSLPKATMDIYFRDNPNVQRAGIAVLSIDMPAEIVSASRIAPTYIILNQTQKPPPWPLVLIARYQKGIGNWYISLYSVKGAQQ